MSEENKKLEIVSVAIGDLKPSEYNPRKMSEKQEQDLTKSLKRFGCLDPLIVNSFPTREGVIIGGHQRFKIMKKLGYKEVPVVYTSLDEKKEKELNLRLNKNTGEFDFDILKGFETDLLLDVGFTQLELSEGWDDGLDLGDDDFNEEKELEASKTTTIKLGDVFQLGRHRLVCGDSQDKETLKVLMDKGKANMIYTDPIFNIALDYNKGLGGHSNYGGEINDKKSDTDYKEFLKAIFVNALDFCHSDLHFFSYCDSSYIWLVQELFKEIGIKNKRVCLWIKNGLNLTPKNAFNKMYEPCIYGTKGNPYLAPIKNLGEILNPEIGVGNRGIEDILDQLDIWLEKRLPGNEYQHPTQKPHTLHERALRRCTKVNDIVLDVFGGSGSLLIACEQLNRKAYLVELNPIFCQLIINRFEKLTGLKAQLVAQRINQ